MTVDGASGGICTVGVVGRGRMGRALAQACQERDIPVLAGGRDIGAARIAARADIIVLATPVAVTLGEVATAIRPHARGKPVVDVSNPCFDASLAGLDAVGSVAERLAGLIPASDVVKAFTCVAADGLGRAVRLAEPLTVPMAGDSAAAKAAVAAVIARLGFDAVDAGPLSSSRWLESLTEHLVRLGAAGTGHVAGFRLVRFAPQPAAVAH